MAAEQRGDSGALEEREEHSSAWSRAEKGKMKARDKGQSSSWIYDLVDRQAKSPRVVSQRDGSASTSSSSPSQPDPVHDPDLHPFGMHFADDVDQQGIHAHDPLTTAPSVRSKNGTNNGLLSTIPSSWDPPSRSFWFEKKAIIIVSIFLAIFIVLFMGAAVFLHDRRYDIEEDESDEEAIQRVLEGRHEVQRKRGRERGDARKEGEGEKEGEEGGKQAPRVVVPKKKLAKRPVTRWIKATVMAPAALFRHRSSRNSSSSNHSNGSRGSTDAHRTNSRSVHSSSSSIVEVSPHPRSSRESAARRSVRSTSASISSGNANANANAGSNLRQRRGRRPRLGDGRTEERVVIEYDNDHDRAWFA